MMDASYSPPKVKSPLPMIPVPQALETVLTETAKSLWFQRQRRGGHDGRNSLVTHQQLLGRTSAKDIKAPPPGYPNHNSSIMDGYAIKTSDLVKAREVYNSMNQEQKGKYVLDFDIVGKVYAGDDDDDANCQSNLDSNRRNAVYVTTGAVVRAGYDAVVPVEETAAVPGADGKNQMHIVQSKVESVINSTKPWTWVRTVGIDIPSDCIVLSKGEKILPVHMALLAQVGISPNDVEVKRLPRVGVLSTGNELLASSANNSSDSQQAQANGKIPDVNRPLLLSQLSTYGNCIPVDLGIVTDDDGYEHIARKLNNEMMGTEEEEGIDVLITTGGISMGEKDIMEQVFVEGMGGEVHFGRMNMKPGKPTTFITIDKEAEKGQFMKKLVFALPGNPVSASVCSELLVRPCLDLLHDGVNTEELSENLEEKAFVEHAVGEARVHEEVMATITSDIKLDQGRPEYRRVNLQRVPSSNNGTANTTGPQPYIYHATGTGVQRSSRVMSLRGADGLMMLPRGGTMGCGYDIARKGMEFPVLLYSSISVSSKTCFKDSMHRASIKPSGKKLVLGVVICTSDGQRSGDDFQSLDATLVNALGGINHASIAQRVICTMQPDAKDGTFAKKFGDIINGPQMKGTNVIFVIVPADSNAEQNGSSEIAFKAGLEVSHAVQPLFSKKANALALRVKKYAAAQDPLAAVFENTVGTVRDGSAVLLTCSDKGLEGAVSAVRGLLGRLVLVHSS